MSHEFRAKGLKGPARPVVDCSADPLLTDQSQRDQCDINNLLKQYRKTGFLPEPRIGQYLDVSEFGDYQESLNRAHALQDYFGSLPADMRERYGNDPGSFLEGIQSPEGREDAILLGLIRKDEPVKAVEPPVEGSAPKLVP